MSAVQVLPDCAFYGDFQCCRVRTVVAIAPAAHEIQRVALLNLKCTRVLALGALPFQVYQVIEERRLVVQYVHAGRGMLRDTGEHSRDIDFFRQKCGPADRGVFPVLSGMERQLTRFPGDSECLNLSIGAVQCDAWVDTVFIPPHADPDGVPRTCVPVAAVEQDQTRVVQLREPPAAR